MGSRSAKYGLFSVARKMLGQGNHAHVLRPRRNIATDKWIIYYLITLVIYRRL